jgi:hypothetical protein
MESVQYRDLDCVLLSNRSLSLLVTQSVGPRLLNLRFQESENILADLPDAILECPGVGYFKFWGGHRLWHAPEVPQRTYLPDDDPVSLIEIEHGLRVVQKTEEATGLQKSMRVRLPNDSAVVVIDHEISNRGLEAVECAPWAITQLRPGGVAILPHVTDKADDNGVLPNRRLVLWPYTDINNACIRWGNRYTFVGAELEVGALKVGFPNSRGWLAYLLNNILFVKRAKFLPDDHYYDDNASSQCYHNPDFLELETLGQQSYLRPGETASHREVWDIHMVDEPEITESAIQTMVEALELDLPSQWQEWET